MNKELTLTRYEAIKMIEEMSTAGITNWSKYTDYNLSEILSIGYGIHCKVGNMQC